VRAADRKVRAQLTADFRRDVKELEATVSPGQGSARLKGGSENT